jgi:hypothetical protein
MVKGFKINIMTSINTGSSHGVLLQHGQIGCMAQAEVWTGWLEFCWRSWKVLKDAFNTKVTLFLAVIRRDSEEQHAGNWVKQAVFPLGQWLHRFPTADGMENLPGELRARVSHVSTRLKDFRPQSMLIAPSVFMVHWKYSSFHKQRLILV